MPVLSHTRQGLTAWHMATLQYRLLFWTLFLFMFGPVVKERKYIYLLSLISTAYQKKKHNENTLPLWCSLYRFSEELVVQLRLIQNTAAGVLVARSASQIYSLAFCVLNHSLKTVLSVHSELRSKGPKWTFECAAPLWSPSRVSVWDRSAQHLWGVRTEHWFSCTSKSGLFKTRAQEFVCLSLQLVQWIMPHCAADAL